MRAARSGSVAPSRSVAPATALLPASRQTNQPAVARTGRLAARRCRSRAAFASAVDFGRTMEVLRSLAPTGSLLSGGSPLVWFIFVACAVLQLPLVMDVCSQLFGVNRLVHNVVSKVLVFLMTICGCLSVYMFHTIFLPRWQQATGSPLVGLTLFATWLFLNSSYRFSRAIMADPGDGYAATGANGAQEKGRPGAGAGEGSAAVLRTCKKCDQQKAPFAHHCQVWCVHSTDLCATPRM